MFTNERAFTLIEMLIVLLIISVLMILIIPNLSTKSKNVHETGCEALVKTVQAQVDLYIFEEGETPDKIEDLIGENYITDDQAECPDGAELILEDGVISTE